MNRPRRGADYPVLSPERKKQLAAFQKAAGIKFKSPELLNLAFMHRSISNESANKVNNERLEFLGDAILGAVTVTLLYENLSHSAEGDLAKIKSVVVSEETLSGIALELGVDRFLLLGRGEELSGGRSKKGILADALEALFGAYYLDSGYRAVFPFISRYIEAEIERVLNRKHSEDYKTLLQELTQRRFHIYPKYQLEKRTGPEHNKLFWIDVVVQDKVFGPGVGRNKKAAEQEAAKIAYDFFAGADP
jgi:ribonuclease-3